jgi:hypothetical protein
MNARFALAVLVFAGATSAYAEDTTPYQEAKRQGVRTCLDEMQSVASFIIGDRPHGSHDVWNSDQTDSRMFSSFVVKGFSDGDSHVSLVVGPDKTGRCYAEYNETAFWPQSCTVIREKIFGKFKYAGDLKETTALLENDNGSLSIYLTPQNNGNACLSTKREVIYNSQ